MVLMHAMDSIVTENLFPYYYSTVNPFFFLRNLFGLFVILGISIAVYRRYITKIPRLKSQGSDLYAITIVITIVISGFLLEGMKMTSVNEFKNMVEEYSGLDYEDEDTLALETFWVENHALVSPRIQKPFDQNMIKTGMEIHKIDCMDCHSPNASAFLGYATAKILSPVALLLDRINGVAILYYLHIILCFAGMALIPFTKLFHIISDPLSLMANSIQDTFGLHDENMLTKQMMELDACTHCSTCNMNCSAGMMFEAVGNEFILPSEKMQALKRVAKDNKISKKNASALFQGLYLCTNCNRCTVACPSGINLKVLWISVRENFIQQRQKDPVVLSFFSFIRAIHPLDMSMQSHPMDNTLKNVTEPMDKKTPLALAPANSNKARDTDLPSFDTFSHCFGCQNCSTICPVVGSFEAPEASLYMLPHQIMYSLGLGLTDTARHSAMTWNCLSCYQCQEHCPQNVSVCDILFQLKNQTYKNYQDKAI